MDLAKYLGKKLQHLRVEHRLSQYDLADKIGAYQNDISRWETGKSMLPMDRAIKICEVLGINMAYFDTSNNTLEINKV